MPRRTGIDVLYDNANGMTGDDLLELSDVATAAEFPLDDEDINQLEEGIPGDFGNGVEDADEMDEEDYIAAISAGIEAAEDYIDTELSPDREEAARYYRAEKFGNEIDGRSQVVMSEVRDTVLSIMPSLLRVFCGNTDAVEFTNSAGTPQDLAQHQTAYINHIIQKDNDGFMLYYSAFKDALVRKTGIFTWWFEEIETVTQEVHTGLSEMAYAQLVIEKQESSSEDENISFDIEVTDARVDTTAPEESPDILPEDQLGLELGLEQEPPQSFIRDVIVRRRHIEKRHRVAAVPPEEFIMSPMASHNLDEFTLVGRRQMKTIGELVAMGHDEEEIREAIGGAGSSQSSTALANNAERIDRNGQVLERIFDPGFSDVDPASEWVKYVTVYVLIDKDGDGILERRKICTVGDANKIIYDEIVDNMVPYAIICPDPEPHSPVGYSLADQSMDFQEIKSEMVRGVLDSLAESIVGRTAIVEGKVNIDDALSNSRDQLIRTKEQGAIWSLSQPFNGMNAMPVLEYLDNMKARRTGITMSPSGLSPDVLQSSPTEAAQAVVDASQDRAEMIARIFAETGIKRLFKGLLKQVVKHQDRKRIIQLRGRPVEINPRSFHANLDLDTNVGLGRGTGAKRIAALTMILGQQKEVYQAYGPTNPIVTLAHISNTVEDLIRESGFNDVSRYMHLVTNDEANQIRTQAEAAPKEPTPEEILAQSQREKNQTDLQKTAQTEATKRAKIQAEDDLKRDQMEQDFYLRAAELLGKFGIQANEQEMRARMEEDRAATELANQATAGAQTALTPPQPGGNR